MTRRRPGAPGDPTIRPFRVQASPQTDIDELRRRLQATRWPERETVSDLTQGVPLATMQELARYWASDYDMRRFETRLNAFPQFMTEIDGLDLHFIHVRSPHECAAAHHHARMAGLGHRDAERHRPAHRSARVRRRRSGCVRRRRSFDPRYGFSAKPTETGWDPIHIADAWITLMRRLGYTRFVAQGGDWGAQVTDVIGSKAPAELLGIHSNMPGTVAPDISRALAQNVLGAATRHPVSAPTSSARTTSSTSSSRRASATHSRWAIARRRCTVSRTPPSPSPPGCSTTTRAASPIS
jgi:Epoxide hydrolase N terminus.